MPSILIFGASGDLTSRKLIPALYQLFRKKRLPADTKIVGSSRTNFTHEAWREELTKTTQQFTGKDFDPNLWSEFAAKIYYQAGDMNKEEDYAGLAKLLDELEGGKPTPRVYYLSTAPQFYLLAIGGRPRHRSAGHRDCADCHRACEEPAPGDDRRGH